MTDRRITKRSTDPRLMPGVAINDAMGVRDGDCLVLNNAWAAVSITREERGNADLGTLRYVYVLSGDDDGRGAGHFTAHNVVAAMDEALRILAVFAAGRAD